MSNCYYFTMKSRFYSLIILFLLMNNVFAINYYANVNINVVDENVFITGLTNHPELYNGDYNHFLTFSEPYYLLNISLFDNFSNYVYEINLPANAIINYMKTPNIMSLDYESNKITITAIGTNEPFKAIIQYSLKDSSVNYYYFLLLIPLFALIFFFLINKSKKKINYLILTSRQLEIFKLIEKKDGITQKEIEQKLDMPKAALSRNIESLVKKDFINKEKKGVTNLLFVKK